MLNVQIIWITWIGEHNIIKYLSFWISRADAHTRISKQEGTSADTHTHTHVRLLYVHTDINIQFVQEKESLLQLFFCPECLL